VIPGDDIVYSATIYDISILYHVEFILLMHLTSL